MKRAMRAAGSLLSILAAFAACNGGGGGGAGGGGEGGKAGSTTTGTGTGAGSGDCPQCPGIRDECIPAGTCTYQGSAFGIPGSKDCWTNGVVQEHTLSAGGISGATVTLNGEACHSWESNLFAMGFQTTFKTPAGEVVGTMTFDFTTQIFTIECDGKTWEIGPGNTCPGYMPDGANCTMGACP